MKSMVFAAAAAWVVIAAAPAMAATTGQYGDVQVVDQGPGNTPVYQLTSSHDNGYAGIYFDFTAAPIALNTITQLSTDYKMTVNTFASGSPRFTIFDTTNNLNNAAYVYFGTGIGAYTDPNAGTYANTGNYADLTSADLRVESNGFGGYSSGYPPITWAQFVAQVGSVDVGYVTIDLDSGYAFPDGQQMLANNFRVNNNVLSAPNDSAVPEPATWAMMIAGFGLVGGAMRRRRTSVAFA